VTRGGAASAEGKSHAGLLRQELRSLDRPRQEGRDHRLDAAGGEPLKGRRRSRVALDEGAALYYGVVLNARIAQIEKSGKKVGLGLQRQLEQSRKESDELKRTIQNNEEAMTQVREKYAADKARFRELTGK
jgi:hypothetical protein